MLTAPDSARWRMGVILAWTHLRKEPEAQCMSVITTGLTMLQP